MTVTIRRVLPKDAYAYTACHIVCWQQAYAGILPKEYLEHLPKELETRAAQLADELSRETGWQYYCAQLGDAIVGRLIFGKSRDADKPAAGEIRSLYLLQDCWGQGYGRQLMEFAIDALQRLGYREALLWVLDENKRARRFYEKYGFVPDGTHKEIQLGGRFQVERVVRPLPGQCVPALTANAPASKKEGSAANCG